MFSDSQKQTKHQILKSLVLNDTTIKFSYREYLTYVRTDLRRGQNGIRGSLKVEHCRKTWRSRKIRNIK